MPRCANERHELQVSPGGAAVLAALESATHVDVMRYEMRKFSNGWAVWDNTTDAPAIHEGVWQTALPLEDADDLTDLLNRLDVQAQPSAKH